MKSFIEALFLHFFILMIIPLFNNFLFKQKKTLRGKVTMTVVILAALSLTMIFPINLPKNIQFDMKFIPIYIAYFYISPISGILSILEVIIFKVFIKPDQVLFDILNYTIISVLFYVSRKFYQRFTMKQKLYIPFLFYLLIMVTRFFRLIQTHDSQYLLHLVLFVLVSSLALSSIIYIIEMNDAHILMMNKLQNADKLNAINQLAASIAHEIRNPMTTIRGFLQLMRDEQNLTREQSSFISVSLSELDRTQDIINDFLSLAKPNKKGHVDNIDVSKHLYSVIDFMAPFAALSKVHLKYQIENELHINGNPNEFKQLMINILKNGIEAMPSGGDIWVTASKLQRIVTITIKDQGVGISKQQMSQLGQPYYSTKTKGTGLGLLISFDIIKRMHGKYEIKSQANKGTCFIIQFHEMNG